MAETRTRHQQRSDATRVALLDAGMRLFHDQGYATTTADHIAAVTGQTTGAFYWHFPTKEDCFIGVIAHRERLRGEWWRIPADLDPATATLDDVLRVVMGEFARTLQGMNAWVLVMVDYRFHARRPEETAELFASVYGGWIDEIVRFVDELKAGGWISTARDSRLLATQLFGLGEGITVHAVLYGADAPAALYDGMVRLLAS